MELCEAPEQSTQVAQDIWKPSKKAKVGKYQAPSIVLKKFDESIAVRNEEFELVPARATDLIGSGQLKAFRIVKTTAAAAAKTTAKITAKTTSKTTAKTTATLIDKRKK